MMRNRGFTLTEILIAIAIIAVIAAIAFPVISRARERGRMAVCITNTRQLAGAVHLYAADFDDKIPILGIIAENRGRWMWQLRTYVKSDDVFTDPNTPQNRYDGSQWTDRAGYGWSGVLQSASNQGMQEADGYSLAAIRKPAETIVIGDTGYDGAAGWCMYTRDPRRAPISDPRPRYWPQFRHMSSKTKDMLDTANLKRHRLPVEGLAGFCFLDGHAKSLSVGTAFREMDSEEGDALADVLTSEAKQPANTRYVLWNVY